MNLKNAIGPAGITQLYCHTVLLVRNVVPYVDRNSCKLFLVNPEYVYL